jgi:hypothetical protein
MTVTALTSMTHVKRVDVVDGVGDLLADLKSRFIVQRPQDSAILQARAQEREDEAVVYTIGTLRGEPRLDVNDVWMRLLYSAIMFQTFHYFHLRGLAWTAAVGAENLQGVERDLVGAFALPFDEPDSRRGAEAKLVKDRVDARIGLELVADVDWEIATGSVAFYVFDIVEARLTIGPDDRGRGRWWTHGGKDGGGGVDADE